MESPPSPPSPTPPADLPDLPDLPDLRRARHDLRGRINALMLCVSAFDVVQSPEEALEFLDMIDRAADKLLAALDTFEAVSLREGDPTAKTES